MQASEHENVVTLGEIEGDGFDCPFAFAYGTEREPIGASIIHTEDGFEALFCAPGGCGWLATFEHLHQAVMEIGFSMEDLHHASQQT
jgi:hypothetical protein